MKFTYKNILFSIIVSLTFGGCFSFNFFSSNKPTQTLNQKTLNGVDKIVYSYYSGSQAPRYQNNKTITITQEYIDYFRGNSTAVYEEYRKQIDLDKFNQIIESIIKNNISKCPINKKWDNGDPEPQTGCSSTRIKIFKNNTVIYNEFDECGMGELCGDYNHVYETINSIMDQSQMVKLEKKTQFKIEEDEEITPIRPISIYFEMNKSLPNALGIKALKTIAKLFLDNNQNNSFIKLYENTDKIGTDEYNYHIGLKRANEVKKILVRNGIPDEKIVTSSYGESNPVCIENTKECHDANRRVDIEVLER